MAGISTPLQLFGDFGFSGGQDVAPNPLQNNQICINFYPEVNKQNPKEILGLLGAPGLVQLVAAPGGGAPGEGGGISAPVTSNVSKTWEASTTTTFGALQTNGVSGIFPIITSINPTIRVADRNPYTAPYTGDGKIYLFNNLTGAAQGTATPTTGEAAIYSGYLNPGGVLGSTNATMYMIDPAGNFAVFANQGLIPSPQVSGGASTNCSIYVTNPGVSSTLYDVLPQVALPVGTAVQGTSQMILPCGDFKHIAVLVSAYDSGAGKDFYALSIISVSSTSAPVRISSQTWSATHGAAGLWGTWFSTSGGSQALGMCYYHDYHGMLESNLQRLWVANLTTGNNFLICIDLTQTPPVQVLASGQTANTFTSPVLTTPNPGGALFADNGELVLIVGTLIARWSVPPSPPKTATWPATSSVTNLPVRGMWELPNDSTALAVIGNTCFLVTQTTPATPFAFPVLALTSVGTLLTNIGPVHIRDNNIGGYAVIVDGPYGYLYNISTRAFSRITDPAFLGADTVAFIDGWWVFNQPGTQAFYTQAQQYGITFNASNFALKDGAPDNLAAVFENKEQLWLLGDKTTEVWYDAGGTYFAFQRLVGTLMQFGCKAKHSVARFSTDGQDGLILFGRTERGENVIIQTRGFNFNVVSTPAFSKEVSQYPIVSDAIGYTYQEDTHEFYMLTFPTADTTWCYDAQSGLLHKRLSYDPYLQQFHRHRSNCFMNFQGMRIVGDYQCGSLYQLTRNKFTDAGWPILAKRRSPHIWDKGQRGRVFMASLQLDFQQGVGNASGLGSNPQAGLSISRDGGKTFGQRFYAPIGVIGQYKNRTMWRRLAFGRDNVLDIEIIDPVPRDIIGVTLKAFSSA